MVIRVKPSVSIFHSHPLGVLSTIYGAMVALLLLSRDLADDTAICTSCSTGVRLLALLNALHFTWMQFSVFKYYLTSEHRMLTLV